MLCYRLNLPEIYTLTEKDFESIHDQWFQTLKLLSNGTVVHKQDIFLKKEFDATVLPNNTFLSNATSSYFAKREYIDHNSYLFFICSLGSQSNLPRFSNPFKKTSLKEVDLLNHRIREFKSEVSDAMVYLNNTRKISVVPLNSEEINELTENYFNGFNTNYHTNILLNKKDITIGENYFEVIAVNNEQCFGEEVRTSRTLEKFTSNQFKFHQGYIDGLGIALNENHIVNQIVYLDDKTKWRKILEKNIDELRKSIHFGSQNKVLLSKIENTLAEINNDDSSRVVRSHLNVIFWSNEQKKMRQIATQIKSEFNELDIVPYSPNGEERKLYFLNSYFCFSNHFSDDDLIITDLKSALCLFLNDSNYKSDTTGILFNDRVYNTPVIKDVWDEKKKRINARNFAIFAPTGEGKSFLANHLLRQFYEDGVRIVIVDLGGSYSKFVKLYPEDHVILKYEEGRNLGINPFFISDEKDLSPDTIHDLTQFLMELLAMSSTANKSQEVALKKVVQYYYQNVKVGHSLQSFYNFIDQISVEIHHDLKIEVDDLNIKRVLHLLSEYVKGGIYSFLFEATEDLSFQLHDKRIIVFELDEVTKNKEILTVMLKLIKLSINKSIWKNKSDKGIILFDEFAKQLKFENVLESVEFYYQAIRKQNGSIGIILQSINQLPSNDASTSILENTQIIYSLKNEKGYKQLQERLNLSNHDINQLKSIQNNFTGKRKYSEVFLKIGRESNVYRLEVPPEVYAAYLTDGLENEQIMDYYKREKCMQKAIKKFIKSSN